jgi:hypothetical protein
MPAALSLGGADKSSFWRDQSLASIWSIHPELPVAPHRTICRVHSMNADALDGDLQVIRQVCVHQNP